MTRRPETRCEEVRREAPLEPEQVGLDLATRDHLRECRDCRSYITAVRRAEATLRDMPRISAGGSEHLSSFRVARREFEVREQARLEVEAPTIRAALLAALPHVPAPPSLRRRVLEQIRRPRRRPRFLLPGLLPLAAALVLFVSLRLVLSPPRTYVIPAPGQLGRPVARQLQFELVESEGRGTGTARGIPLPARNTLGSWLGAEVPALLEGPVR